MAMDNALLGALAVACVRGTQSTADVLPSTTRVYIDTLRAVGTSATDTLKHALKHHQRVNTALKVAKVNGAALKAWVASGVPLKSIQSTRLDSEQAITDLLDKAVEGDVRQAAFVTRMMSIIRGYGFQAYRDGLKAGGVNDEMDEDDIAQAERLAQEQRRYVNGIASQIYEDDKVTTEETEGRASMWFSKSIYPFYLLGLESASANLAVMWVMNARKENCVSCQALDGQVRRIKYWMSTIIPKSINLACSGYNCGCVLTPTDRPISRGKLPNWYPA